MKRLIAAGLAALVVVLASGAAAQPDPPGSPFGAVEAFWLPDAACELGLGWERIIFDWSEMQPAGPDDWNPFNVPDEWLTNAAACGREVVGVIKHTPAWATDGTAGIGVPRGLYLDPDDPDNLWAHYIRRMAAYYGERGVNRFIIWNEPDIPAGTYGYEFEGSVEDYARLVEMAAIAARAVNPDAEIILAGTTYWHDINAGQPLYLGRLLDAMGPDAGQYFDAVALHIYFRTDTVEPIVEAYVGLLADRGLAEKDIWVAETNASPNLDPLWPVERPQYQITLDEQGAFLVQAAAVALASGADRVGMYKLFDWSLPPGAESFGLIRADESRRPAFDAWRNVIAQMSGARTAAVAQNELATVVRMQRADGQTLITAWARTDQPVVLRLTGVDANIAALDQYGNMWPVVTFDGAMDVSLSPARCSRRDGCPVGGAPVLVLGAAERAAIIDGEAVQPLEFGQERTIHVG